MLRISNAARNTVTRRLSLQDKRGGFARYDADDNGNVGKLSAYTTKSGRTYESADIVSTLQVIRDEDGAISQVWNAWDGLMVSSIFPMNVWLKSGRRGLPGICVFPARWVMAAPVL